MIIAVQNADTETFRETTEHMTLSVNEQHILLWEATGVMKTWTSVIKSHNRDDTLDKSTNITQQTEGAKRPQILLNKVLKSS